MGWLWDEAFYDGTSTGPGLDFLAARILGLRTMYKPVKIMPIRIFSPLIGCNLLHTETNV